MNVIKDFFLDANYVPLLAGLSAFVMSTSFYLYPVIINVSRQKGLMDAPDNRKMHKNLTPTLGGVGVFIAFSLSIIFYGIVIELVHSDLVKLLALLGSSIILLFLGVKDDLVSMSPKMKFLGQLLAAINVVVITDVRIISFEGLLGVGELPYVISILFSIFVFILIINSLNLIDGIDGLAGLISVISSLIFGILFFVDGYYLMTLVSSIFIGSILGFLRYNLSSKQKIFMGDSGSMLAGFLLAYQGVNLIALNTISVSSSTVINAPVILLAIISYPLFDLLRVFAIRIKQGKSPFSPDANHIHHKLLRLGLDHKQATLVLGTLSVLVIAISFLFDNLEIHLHLLITVLFGSLLYLSPFLRVFERNTSSRETQLAESNGAEVLATEVKDLTSLEAKLTSSSGINSSSIVYSKNNGIDKHEEILNGAEVTEMKTKKVNKDIVENDFETIVTNRRQNLQMVRKKLADKKQSESEIIFDKE